MNNTSKFVDYYKGEMKKLVSSLHEEYTKTKDKVTKIKLKETLNLLRKQKVGRKVTDNQVSTLMMGFELIKEMKNVRK